MDFSSFASEASNSCGTSDGVSVWTDGSIEVQLEDTDVERAKELARQRNESYQSGETTDDNFSDTKSGGDLHVQGLLAEIAMERVYGVPVDETVSPAGDG